MNSLNLMENMELKNFLCFFAKFHINIVSSWTCWKYYNICTCPVSRNHKSLEVKNMQHKSSNWLKSGLISAVTNQKKLACILVPAVLGGDHT